MISISDLRSEIERIGHVVVSVEDELILDPVVHSSLTSPTALVTPMTDALKDVTSAGVVTGPIDRGETWRVAAVYLDDRAVAVIEGDRVSARDLYESVAAAGLRWKARRLDEFL